MTKKKNNHNLIHSSDIQVNYKLNHWQGLVEIIEQFRSKERRKRYDTTILIVQIIRVSAIFVLANRVKNRIFDII